MKIRTRNLNKSESYACDIKDIKKIFSKDDDLSVSFGFISRNFRFDNKFINRPLINGQVISSLSINRRLNVIGTVPNLCFYVIRDDKYNENYKNIFVDSILPELKNWVNDTSSKSDTAIPGIEELLIEWDNESFKLHKCRYA